jgi:hypothetical protein
MLTDDLPREETQKILRLCNTILKSEVDSLKGIGLLCNSDDSGNHYNSIVCDSCSCDIFNSFILGGENEVYCLQCVYSVFGAAELSDKKLVCPKKNLLLQKQLNVAVKKFDAKVSSAELGRSLD